MTSPTEPALDLTDRRTLRHAFGAFATGVVVVTVGGPEPHAMTANSFTTVSLEPPLLMVCVGRDAIMHQALPLAGHFGVSVLASHQERIARHFADNSRPLGMRQFEIVDWSPGPATGAPLIVGALAQFECELWRSYDGGDHTIFVGGLKSLDRRAQENALVFLGGRFVQLDRA